MARSLLLIRYCALKTYWTGELICFFRATPRIVRNHQIGGENELPTSPAAAPRSAQFSQSPASLSDAVRRLSHAATDQRLEADSRRPGDNEHTLRIMTNLLTFSQRKAQRDFGFEMTDDTITNDPGNNIPMIPTYLSTVFIKLSRESLLARRKVAAAYIFYAGTLEDLCRFNANIARHHGQFAHERMFLTLQSLFPAHAATRNIFGVVPRRIIKKMSVCLKTISGCDFMAFIGMPNFAQPVTCKRLPC